MNPRRAFDILVWRLRLLLRRARLDQDLDRELRFHIDQETRENITKGMPPEQARQVALRRLGELIRIKEECRDMRRLNQLETTWNDLRYSVRLLGQSPGFTAVIVLTLGLSIGANSAIFSVIEGVLLRPLPYPQPERMVRIFLNSDRYPKFPLNPFDFRDFRERNQTFDSIAAINRSDIQLSGSGDPVMLRAFRVTAGYFHVLGFAPASGRDFTTDDELPEHGRLAILSDRLWRTRFSSDTSIIGRSVMLNSEPYTVAGVMPPGVQHPGNDYHSIADGDTVDIWLPFTFDGDPNQRGSHYVEGIGRLAPGMSPEQANADLSAILDQLGNEHPNEKGWGVFLVPLYQEMVGRTRHMLLVLLGAVGLLLLIACVNAANLLLARSSGRRREIAVREALGAGRSRIVRQLLTESVVIAMAGAALGSVLAIGGVRALVSLLPVGFPRSSAIRLDPTVFAFTLSIALVTGLLFGIVPALAGSRTDLQQNLREGGRGATGSRRQLHLRSGLVVAETGLASVLLITAGLMLHSFVNLLRTDPGYRPQEVLTASVSLPFKQYGKNAQIRRFYEQLIADLQTMPGVQSTGVGSDLPWTGWDENIGGFIVEGQPPSFNQKTTARYHVASPDYFPAMGIPLLAGRPFNAQDTPETPNVIIVNQEMARRYWSGEDALGKRIAFNDEPKEKDWFQIVGIVGDVKDRPDSSGAHPGLWWPLGQMPFPFTDMSVVIHSNSDAARLAEPLRLAVNRLDPGLAVSDVRLMKQIASESVSSQRFALFLVILFAGLALVLATIGIYGVISYSVNQRMGEFGMRLALGASPGRLTRLILGQGMRLTVAGSAIGLLSAALFGRLLGNLLYGVTGADPVTLAAVGFLALGTAALACYLPARRAGQADPVRSLRSE